jgi:protein tyrosine phosphatase (PTP) superfamily phosphohydrolase (DUF442 family)
MVSRTMAMDTGEEQDHPSPRNRQVTRRGWLKAVAWGLAGYLGLAVLSTGFMFAGVAVTRALGQDPRAKDDSLPPIKHLRWVDDKLLAGAQPHSGDYVGLGDLGVSLVVDVRTGSDDDPVLDDPEYLASLGIDYLQLPIRDGRVPTDATVRRFVDSVEAADGLVFMHCGGGVGRSTSLQAAYQATRGEHPSLWKQLAVGPPTLEQAWFIASAAPGDPTSESLAVSLVSRALDAPRRILSLIK